MAETLAMIRIEVITFWTVVRCAFAIAVNRVKIEIARAFSVGTETVAAGNLCGISRVFIQIEKFFACSACFWFALAAASFEVKNTASSTKIIFGDNTFKLTVLDVPSVLSFVNLWGLVCSKLWLANTLAQFSIPH